MPDLPATVATASPATYDPEKLQLIRDMFAKGATDSEFKLFIEMSLALGLNPLKREIWLVKYGDNPAQIFVGRDGLLTIAHRSGQFDGMHAGTRKDGDELVGWCRVYRRDMTHPFEVEVYEKEYTTGRNLWKDKPRTMIQKVAEAQCLRRAFSISGVYTPEEVDTGDRPEPRYVGEVPAASSTTCEVCGIPVPEEIREQTKPHTDRVLCVEHFGEWWNAKQEATE